ncbi:MAG: hypothetical protein ABIO44_02710 [Saprospiraceae bacterium]
MNFNIDKIWPSSKLSYVLIALVSILLYFRCIDYGFVLDDTIVYDENKFVDKGFSGIWPILSTESFTGYFGVQQDYVEGARYRPLSILSFAIEKQIFGKSPKAAHSINIILYILCGIVVFGFLKRIIKDQFWQKYIPLIGALLFICHPIHTEAVANIKGRDEIMCLLFSMLALNSLFDYFDSKSRKYILLTVAYYFLALMSKENAITFLLIMPLSLVFFRNVKFIDSIKKTWFIWIPAILFLIIRTQVIGFFLSNGAKINDLMNNPFVGMNPSEKFSTIIFCIGWYIKLLFVPHPLTHDYYPYHVPKLGLGDALTWMSLIFVFSIILLSYVLRKKHSTQWYSILFFFISLSIVSNIVFPVGTFMNERFLFIPSIAFIVFVCYWLNEVIVKYPSFRTYTFSFVSLLLLAYSVRTITRVPDWMSSDSLNFAAIKVSKNSARINLFTGVTFFHKAEVEARPLEKKKLLDESNRYIDKALYIYPDYGQALNMKAGVLAEYHKLSGGTEDFLIHIAKVVERKPDLKFVKDYLKYIETQPNNKDLLYDYYSNTGYLIFYKKTKRYDFAVDYLEEAYRLRRNDKALLERMIEVYSIIPTLKGVPEKQATHLKERLADLKLFYQMTLH